jgi:hypothetical protein
MQSTWPLRTVARAADVDSCCLRQWFGTGVLQLRGNDKKSTGTGHQVGLSRKRAHEAALVQHLNLYGVSVSRAAKAAFEFTLTGNGGRAAGQLFPMGKTVLVLTPTGSKQQRCCTRGRPKRHSGQGRFYSRQFIDQRKIKMLNVPKLISPDITAQQAVFARLDMRAKAASREVRELRERKLQGQNNVNDKTTRISMVLAEQDIPATDDTDVKLTAKLLQWEAIEEAKESLKPKLAIAKREAADKILAGLKKPHDAIMARLLAALVDAHAANVELFDLRSQLRDREIGFRNGVCELMPDEVLSSPTIYSPLADFFRAAVKAGFLKALPAGFVKP